MSSLHVSCLGAGKPLVLVHGWAMHSSIWRRFAERLAERYRVICVDLPGHGLSENTEPYTLESVSQAVVDAVDEPCAYWLGWSLGATVALAIASRFPERVRGLLLLAGNPRFIRQAHWPGMSESVLESFSASLLKDSQATLLRFLSLQINPDLPDYRQLLKELKTAVLASPKPNPLALQGGLRILQHTDLTAELAALKQPVAVILAEKDTLVPVAVAAKIQQLLPHAELNIVQRAGHVAFLSHEAELVKLVGDFVDRHE